MTMKRMAGSSATSECQMKGSGSLRNIRSWNVYSPSDPIEFSSKGNWHDSEIPCWGSYLDLEKIFGVVER